MGERYIDYVQYQPAGWSDDLGIIADRNQWVDEMPGGWHTFVYPNEWAEIREWLDDNNIWHETYYSRIVLKSEKDVVLFKLRWC